MCTALSFTILGEVVVISSFYPFLKISCALSLINFLICISGGGECIQVIEALITTATEVLTFSISESHDAAQYTFPKIAVSLSYIHTYTPVNM